MRNLLAFAAAAFLAFAGVGWYLGWYSVQSNKSPTGHRNLNIDIDGAKINDDVQRGKDAVMNEVIERARQHDASRGADEGILPSTTNPRP